VKSGYQNQKTSIDYQWFTKPSKTVVSHRVFNISFLISICCIETIKILLRHMEWFEAADLIVKGMEGAINAKTVTYDFERLMDDAKLLKCSEFGDAIIANM